MSYDDLKVVEAKGFLAAVGGDAEADGATIDDAVAMAATLDAIAVSAVSGRWEQPKGQDR
jgi:hypothetical protein